MKLQNLLLASASVLFVPLIVYAQRPELVIQTGHSRAVQSAAFSRDGRSLATASGDDETVRIWDVATGRELRSMAADNAAEYVAFSPDGATLYSGGLDWLVAWEVKTGRELRRFAEGSGGRYSALSEDGRLLASAYLQGIKIWDPASGKEVRQIEVGKRFYSALAFSPDGKTVAAGNQSADGIIDLWDVASGALVRSISGAHSANVTVLAFGPDGRTLVSAGGDSVTKVWDLSRGKALHDFKGKYGASSFTLSPDRKTIASFDFDGVELREAATGRSIARVRHLGCSLALYHPGGRDILVGASERLALLSGDGWRERQVYRGRVSEVTSVAFSPDGKAIGSGQAFADSAFKVWSAGAGREFRSLKCLTYGSESVSFSPDGRLLACGSGNLSESAINFWDVKSGAVVRSFTGHTERANSLVFSPDGRLLALKSPGGKEFKLWEVTTGRLLRQFAGHSSRTAQIAFSPDGKHLVSSGLDGVDDVIKIWDVGSGRELRKFVEAADINSPFAISPDGGFLAVWDPWNGGVNLLDMETGVRVRTMEGVGTATVQALAFSPDGLTLASGDWGGPINLWKAADGKLLHALSGHANVVNDLAFSPDGKMLLSGGRDTKATLWDVATGQEIVSLIALDAEDWLAVTPDGLFDGTPATWRQILWRFNRDTLDVAPVEAYFSEFYYPGLLNDILMGQRPRAAQDIAQRERRQPGIGLSAADGQAADRGTTAAREITLRIRVTEHPAGGAQDAGVGARDVRLFRNGSLVRAWRGDVLGGRDAVTLEATVPLVAGENAFTAYAFNRDNVKSADAALVVTGADALRRKSTAYVLAVGVNEYANPRYNLKYAVADARIFTEELRRQQEKLGRYDRVEINSLLDKEATKPNILRALGELQSRVRPEDVVFVYFAGHGTAKQNRFYLIPHDLGYSGPRDAVDETGLKEILTRSISDRELEEAFEKVDAGQILFVVDACNSGQALESEEKRRGPMNSKGLAQLAYEKGMYILTASQSFQLANETPRLGHGFLTYALIDEGLSKGAADKEPNDGQIFAREWLNFTAERVPQIHQEQMDLGSSTGPLILGSAGNRGVRLVKLKEDDVQRPRVFYRREPEAQQLIIAEP